MNDWQSFIRGHIIDHCVDHWWRYLWLGFAARIVIGDYNHRLICGFAEISGQFIASECGLFCDIDLQIIGHLCGGNDRRVGNGIVADSSDCRTGIGLTMRYSDQKSDRQQRQHFADHWRHIWDLQLESWKALRMSSHLSIASDYWVSIGVKWRRIEWSSGRHIPTDICRPPSHRQTALVRQLPDN